MENLTALIVPILFPYVQAPSTAVIAENPNADSNTQRILTCMECAEKLARERVGEVNFVEMLTDWIPGHLQTAIASALSTDALGEAWSAIRMELPPGTTANVALFSVWTPTQKNWPTKFKAPPINASLPMTPIHGTLGKAIRSIATRLEGMSDNETLQTIDTQLNRTLLPRLLEQTEAADVASHTRGRFICGGVWQPVYEENLSGGVMGTVEQRLMCKVTVVGVSFYQVPAAQTVVW